MSDELDRLADDYWSALLDHQPTWRHMLGDYADVSSYEECSREAEQEYAATLRRLAQRAQDLDAGALDEEGGLTREVLIDSAVASAELAETPLTGLAANPVSGLQVQLPLVLGLLSVPDAAVAEQMPAKLDGVGTYLHQLAERVRDAADGGWVSPEFAVRETLDQLERALAVPLEEEPVAAAVRIPEGVEADELRGELRAAVERSVRPGLTAFRDALQSVVADARPEERCGLSWLDGGDEAYAASLRYFTTTDKSPREIHEIGLAQVAKLADEYRALGPEVVGTDDLEQIFEAMRTDPKLHFEHADELVEQSKVALARAEAVMGDWFEVVPKAPCAVEGTTVGAKAFYFAPATDGSRGGTFFVNTEDASSWGRFELEAMAFHEGVPGHHLQLAVASELPDSIPEFRKHVHNSAYSEGWGLYSERLSDEMGLYSEAIDRMGMYSADSMRACRLVVDTGIHALGWSRQQAIDYMVANSPLTEGVCRPEVDRYICRPGQATSYMIGRLEIQRMRREAEERQGDRFDVRRFHTAVLGSGALPLGVLDRVVAGRLT
ncbi:MAG TPA: DUF885 domain-containing protein [Nocardioides sp.]|uniref:DUF885 domain-containing protein n=1 Tax=Nocardioides sp. TaxID=35761 RepID=UPI002F3FEF3A